MIMNVKKLILASLLLAVAGLFLYGCKSKMAKAPCPKAEAAVPGTEEALSIYSDVYA
jgi:hypothetical protein